MTDAELIVETIVKALRQVAPNCDGDNDHSYLQRLADNINAGPAEWIRCPLCEEIVCTPGCALEPVLVPAATADPPVIASEVATDLHPMPTKCATCRSAGAFMVMLGPTIRYRCWCGADQP